MTGVMFCYRPGPILILDQLTVAMLGLWLDSY